MNPYIGLEEYISWDSCGIGRGKFITESAFVKLKESDKEVCRAMKIDKDTDKEKIVYFQPNDRARKICVEHLKEAVDLNRLYTPEVITKDVLSKIEPIINEKFRYGVDELDIETLDEILKDEEND